ncbi:type I secretion C-terminal target domain-containing protein [Brasilonema sp. CT11]|nr:type I secretion C-terminal target domain-containing protein [Brasilonema sp. CT11]
MASNPGLLISEIFTNPSGNDSPFEYVELLATQTIDFSANPYSVVFTDNGTATSSGWIAGGSITYGFDITSGVVNAGDVVYVGGSSLAPTGRKLRTINTATTNGDRFGNANSAGVLGNGGGSADAVGVFNVNINNLTNSTVPTDAIFFGTAEGNAVVSGGTAGYQLPVNDRYSGGKLQSNSFLAPDPASGDVIVANGTFNTTTNTFTTARSWNISPATNNSSAITLTSGGGSGAAPTIQEATASPFVNLPATSAGAVSGVIADPTDPAKTLGLDFTIADADTPLNNLTVTAVSNNPNVVTNANLTLSGTGASRNLKINPTGVGFADVTVTVSDGTNTNSYLVNYAASAASVTPNTTHFHTGTSDASTAIAIDSNYMLVGDDENQVLRLYDRNQSGLALNGFDFTSSLGLTDTSGSGAIREVDIEAATRLNNTIYWTGSNSNSSTGDSRPNRDRLFATQISGTGANTTLSYQGRYDYLEQDVTAWDKNNGHGLGANYLGLTASATPGVIPESTNGYNIEGLTIAPNNTTAYVAFRAPLEPASNRSDALIVPVTNFTSLLSSTGGGTQGSATFGAPILLDLGGRGIREIQRNASNQYVIIAGSTGSSTGTAPNDFRLFTWTGNPTDAPELRSANLTALNTGGSFESIVAVPDNLTSTSQLQLLTDNGDTVFYNNGTAAKDLAQNNFKKFRSDTVTLGDTVGKVFNGTSGRDSITGTEGNDTIIGGAGADTLTGGDGYDQFVYTNIRDSGDTITDFKVGTDKIVLTQLLDSLVSGGYNGTNAIADNYVKVVQGSSANNFSVQIDADGPTGGDIFRPFITVNLTSTSTGTLNDPRNFVF